MDEGDDMISFILLFFSETFVFNTKKLFCSHTRSFLVVILLLIKKNKLLRSII